MSKEKTKMAGDDKCLNRKCLFPSITFLWTGFLPCKGVQLGSASISSSTAYEEFQGAAFIKKMERHVSVTQVAVKKKKRGRRGKVRCFALSYLKEKKMGAAKLCLNDNTSGNRSRLPASQSKGLTPAPRKPKGNRIKSSHWFQEKKKNLFLLLSCAPCVLKASSNLLTIRKGWMHKGKKKNKNGREKRSKSNRETHLNKHIQWVKKLRKTQTLQGNAGFADRNQREATRGKWPTNSYSSISLLNVSWKT